LILNGHHIVRDSSDPVHIVRHHQEGASIFIAAIPQTTRPDVQPSSFSGQKRRSQGPHQLRILRAQNATAQFFCQQHPHAEVFGQPAGKDDISLTGRRQLFFDIELSG
jgi:hypothetical protein